MESASQTVDERARKNQSAILHGLSRIGQATAAAAIGVSESTLSRMKEKDIEQMSMLLSACGLKIVPQEFRCAKPQIIEAALVFAKEALEQISRDSTLIWDEH